MRIEIYGQQLEITPALNDYVHDKLQRLDRHFDRPLEIRVQLSVAKTDHRAVATVNIPGKTLHTDADAPTMYAAIDLLADKLDRLLIKHKDKKRRPHRNSELTDT